MKSASLFFCISIFVLAFNSSAFTQQTCKPESIAQTNSHLSAKSDGTVVDTRNKLMWKRCPEGFNYSNNSCTSATINSYSWANALKVPVDTNINGYPAGSVNYKNWRMPNIKELQSIVEERCYNPAINFSIFPFSSVSKVWSNSPSDILGENKKTWYIDFLYGEMLERLRGESLGVRLVRDCTGTECD